MKVRVVVEENTHRIIVEFKLIPSMPLKHSYIETKLVSFDTRSYKYSYVKWFDAFVEYNYLPHEIKEVNIPDNIYNYLVMESVSEEGLFLEITRQYEKLSVLEQHLFTIRILEQLK